jgi:inorganic pyrophosphatase
MNLKKIRPIQDGQVNVIIETPRNSQNKFTYDPDLDIFKLTKTLPMGAMFPFDFGFIPNTIAEDGDPLDVLVIMDQQAYPGCLIECRVIGILKADQIESETKKERNDRLVAVSNCSVLYNNISNIKQLNQEMTKEIERFFIDYNDHAGKKFIPLGWGGTKSALKAITQQTVKRNR